MILTPGLNPHCTIQCASRNLKASLAEHLANWPTSKAEVPQLGVVTTTSHTTDILWTEKKVIAEMLPKKTVFGIKFTFKYPNTSNTKEKKKRPHNVNSMSSACQMLQLRKQQITYKHLEYMRRLHWNFSSLTISLFTVSLISL